MSSNFPENTSELSQLDTIYAPKVTKNQCVNRINVLEPIIDAGWALIDFIKKLDPAMYLAWMNYAYTQPQSEEILEQEAISYPSMNTEPPKQTKSLSPKKSRRKRTKTPVLSV